MPYVDKDKKRAHDREYARRHMDRIVSLKRTARQKKYDEIILPAKSKPCADCRVEYPPYVMQFDHVRGEKLFAVSSARGRGMGREKILAEIAKCDVVCANCHAERSFSPKDTSLCSSIA